jgi:DNA-binding NarL/FixJ family response regulator
MRRGVLLVRLSANRGREEAAVSDNNGMSILIADDQCQVRRALRAYLQLRLGGATIAEAEDMEQALRVTPALRPDVVLLDWELPAQGGAPAMTGLRSLHPTGLIVALSSRPEARQDALAAGADAFVSKGEPADRLIACMSSDRLLE